MKGYAGTILEINLSENSITKEPLKESFANKFVGGKGFTAKILLDELDRGIDPLSPENLLLFMTGPLTGTAVPQTRIAVAAKSPLTGTFFDSYVGGFLGPELKWAGYDGIKIIGRGEKPVLLYVKNEDVDILDADKLWGKNSIETEFQLKKTYGTDHRVASIGRAGENLVKYACINTEFYRHAGRGGLGAVMGSKMLKAVLIRGTNEVEVEDQNSLHTAIRDFLERVKTSVQARNWRNLGTANNVLFSSSISSFPTRNFQSGTFDGDENISAERAKESLWDQGESCYNCPIACGHIGVVKSGEFAGSEINGPEYETLAMLGGNCGLSDLDALVQMNRLCDDFGMDTVSTGNVIGFTMELFGRSILSKTDLDGIEAKWGSPNAMISLITKISERKGVGDMLAEGVKRASEVIGRSSEKYAMHVKGLEIPGWGIRALPSMGLHYATGTSAASHERAWMIPYDMGWAPGPDGRKLERYFLADKVGAVKYVQDRNAMIDSLVVCAFGPAAVNYDIYVPMFNAVTGSNLSMDDHLKIGERIWNLTKLFNVREGFSGKDDTLPSRFFDEPLPAGAAEGIKIDRKEFKLALSHYYISRGWDERGIPTPAKLSELGIEFRL